MWSRWPIEMQTRWNRPFQNDNLDKNNERIWLKNERRKKNDISVIYFFSPVEIQVNPTNNAGKVRPFQSGSLAARQSSWYSIRLH